MRGLLDSARMSPAPADARIAGRRAAALRGAGLVALALVSFETVAAGLRALTPLPEEFGLRAKFDWFAEHKDEFDVLFLGSSRVFRGIDPRIVDAELAAEGVPLRTFNFGVGGLRRFEACYVMHRLLELGPARLSTVVVEAEPWEPSTEFLMNTWSSRMVAWHDLEHTRLALVSVMAEDAPLAARIRKGWTHVQLFAMRLHVMGQGSRIVLDLLGRSRDPWNRSMSADEIARAAGYQAYEEIADAPVNAWQEAIAKDAEWPAKVMGHVARENDAAPDLARYNFAALRAQVGAIRAAGAEWIALSMPGNEGGPDDAALHARGDVPRYLDFNRPGRYPEYWTPQARFDDLHLSRSGAQEFSRALAQALVPLLRADH